MKKVSLEIAGSSPVAASPLYFCRKKEGVKKMKSNYFRIETMREIRMWIKQIIVPLAGIVIFSQPSVKEWVQNQMKGVQK